jgi:hypothetical protein
MPFSGIFQSQNINSDLVLNNVLDDITYNTSVSFDITNSNITENLNDIRGLLHRQSSNRFFVFKRGGDDNLYGFNYTGTQYTLSGSTTVSYSDDRNIPTRACDACFSPDGTEMYVTGDLINIDEGITNIRKYELDTIRTADGNRTVRPYYWFSNNPFKNTSIYNDALDAICMYRDQNDGDQKNIMCIANNGVCVTIDVTSSGARNNIQNRDLGSDLGITNVSGVIILYQGLRCLILNTNGVLYECDYQTDDINSTNAYKLSELRVVQSINLKTISGGLLVKPQSFWCLTDDPYTSGIWVVDEDTKKVHQFFVNGTKYSSV